MTAPTRSAGPQDVDDNELNPLECDHCGGELVGKDPRLGWYHDCEVIECPDCQAQNLISCDAESVYVSSWVCRHDKRDDEPCELCEIEIGQN